MSFDWFWRLFRRPTVKPDPVPAIAEDIRIGASLHLGWTAVDQKGYNGWAGACPGCDIDAMSMCDLFKSLGVPTTILLNEQATWEAVQKAALEIAKSIDPKTIFVITESGHGGQVRDDNGDEKDQWDETVCMWDQQVRDDHVMELFRKFPVGLPVVLISDQCHSQGNFRAVPPRVASPIIKPMRYRARGPGWNGPLIQFAGCREAGVSYGGDEGGTWTQALLKTFVPNMTWKQWYDAAAREMDRDQVPMWVEFGGVSTGFRNGIIRK